VVPVSVLLLLIVQADVEEAHDGNVYQLKESTDGARAKGAVRVTQASGDMTE
jgi:hypothetical protein